jgi:PXPV repeat-containing protein
MERTGQQIADRPILAPPKARRLRAGWLFLAGALALGGCYVVPVRPAYVAPAPVYVAPAPVYVAPAPVYYYGGYRYGGYRYGGYRHYR